MMRKPPPGAAGWAAVAAVVVVAEFTDERTMSEAFFSASRHPVAGPVVFAAWAIVTAHLFGFMSPRYDPIHQAAKRTLLRGRSVT